MGGVQSKRHQKARGGGNSGMGECHLLEHQEVGSYLGSSRDHFLADTRGLGDLGTFPVVSTLSCTTPSALPPETLCVCSSGLIVNPNHLGSLLHMKFPGLVFRNTDLEVWLGNWGST